MTVLSLFVLYCVYVFVAWVCLLLVVVAICSGLLRFCFACLCYVGSSRCFMVIGLVWVVACSVILVGLRLWEVWILWILCFGFRGYSCFVI